MSDERFLTFTNENGSRVLSVQLGDITGVERVDRSVHHGYLVKVYTSQGANLVVKEWGHGYDGCAHWPESLSSSYYGSLEAWEQQSRAFHDELVRSLNALPMISGGV